MKETQTSKEGNHITGGVTPLFSLLALPPSTAWGECGMHETLLA